MLAKPYKAVWQGVAFAKHKDYQSFKRTVVIPIIKPTAVSRFKGDIQGDLASFYQISVSGTVVPWKSEGHQGTFVASEVVSCDFSGPHSYYIIHDGGISSSNQGKYDEKW